MAASAGMKEMNPYTTSESYSFGMFRRTRLTLFPGAELTELDEVFYPKPTDAYLDTRILLLFVLTAM